MTLSRDEQFDFLSPWNYGAYLAWLEENKYPHTQHCKKCDVTWLGLNADPCWQCEEDRNAS